MHGLLRVRGFTQDDAHIFCTPEQIEREIADCVEFARDVLRDFGFDKFQTELSVWDANDRKSYVGSEEQWNMATASLENVLKRLNIEYKVIPGEAAFYGPKIDIKLVDAVGACGSFPPCSSTSTCRSASGGVCGETVRAAAAHGSPRCMDQCERFFGVLIEHYAGAFPVWLSPVQVVMIPISERHADYANKLQHN